MTRTRKFAITGTAIAAAAALAIGGSVAASADDRDGKQRGKDGKSGGALTSLVDDGTLTESDVDAIRDAMKAAHERDQQAHQAERAAAKAEILADLVANGTLTQSQADAVDAAIAAKQAEMGERMKGKWGNKGEGKRGAMKGARA